MVCELLRYGCVRIGAMSGCRSWDVGWVGLGTRDRLGPWRSYDLGAAVRRMRPTSCVYGEGVRGGRSRSGPTESFVTKWNTIRGAPSVHGK